MQHPLLLHVFQLFKEPWIFLFKWAEVHTSHLSSCSLGPLLCLYLVGLNLQLLLSLYLHPGKFLSLYSTLKFKVIIIRNPAYLAATYSKASYSPKLPIVLSAAVSLHLLPNSQPYFYPPPSLLVGKESPKGHSKFI